MPFFKKIDAQQKAKLEHKMCLAKDTPEPIFDISDCGIYEVPPGVFSMCKVFRKDELFLQKNNLTSLKGGGSLEDLIYLRVLDLSFNKFTTLPQEIGHLECLQVLNLANNRLKKLPEAISQLLKLTNLDLSNNCLTQIQECVCHLPSLQVLNLCNNPSLNKLPRNLCLLTSLYSLTIDCDNVTYPPSDICKDGTVNIMKFLCKECEIDYQPSSVDTLSSSSRGASVSSLSFSDASPSTPGPPDSFLQLQLSKDRRRKEIIDMEAAMRRNEQLHLEIGLENNTRRQKLIQECKEDQDRMHSEIVQLQDRKDKEKKLLLDTLNNIEEHSSQLMSQLLEMNEKARSSEAMLEALERDRIETEELFNFNQQEIEEARKRDVLLSMKEMLAAEEKQRYIEAKRLAQSHKNNESPLYIDKKIKQWLAERENDQQALLAQLQDEEMLQRKAFLALQILRDSQHNSLTQQIKLIEWELTKLTEAEIRKKDAQSSFNMAMVVEQRTALANLLSVLLSQRESREEQLKRRLKEMEEQRAEEMKDYWLIQYQKLMERKPQDIIDVELAMDSKLKQILVDVGAESLVTQFAMAQLDLNHVALLTTQELHDLGVTHRGMQRAILSAVKEVLRNQSPEEESCACNLSPKDSPVKPTAPSPDISPSAPDRTPIIESKDFALSSDIKIWHQTECVVCLDKESAIVFLPCGHVCSCYNCAGGLDLCPLCRIPITTKLTLGSY